MSDDWRTVRKTQTADAILVEDVDDLPDHDDVAVFDGEVKVDTSHGVVSPELPFYLMRGPDGEVYPHSVDTFRDRYEPVRDSELLERPDGDRRCQLCGALPENHTEFALRHHLAWASQRLRSLSSSATREGSPRLFQLVRHEDETGVSGEGVVAYGVQSPEGQVVMGWRVEGHSTSAYDSIETVRELHGHGGKTEIEFLDAPGVWITQETAEEALRSIQQLVDLTEGMDPDPLADVTFEAIAELQFVLGHDVEHEGNLKREA